MERDAQHGGARGAHAEVRAERGVAEAATRYGGLGVGIRRRIEGMGDWVCGEFWLPS